MASVLKISEAASLAMHTLSVMAKYPSRQLSAKELAQSLRVSEAHLAKVLQRLARAHILSSCRGPKGGFQLARAPHELSLLEIYETLEGQVSRHACMLDRPYCGGNCILGGLADELSKQFRESLSKKMLSDLGRMAWPEPPTDAAAAKAPLPRFDIFKEKNHHPVVPLSSITEPEKN